MNRERIWKLCGSQCHGAHAASSVLKTRLNFRFGMAVSTQVSGYDIHECWNKNAGLFQRRRADLFDYIGR